MKYWLAIVLVVVLIGAVGYLERGYLRGASFAVLAPVYGAFHQPAPAWTLPPPPLKPLEASSPAPSATAVTTVTATRTPRVSRSTVFDPKEVVVGDQYGQFKVTDARFRPATGSYPHDMYSIGFAGTTTLTGTVGHSPEMGCFTPLENIPTAVMQQLPRSTEANAYVPSNTLDLAMDAVPYADQPAEGDRVEVTINRFISAYEAKECGGDYGVVVSIKKI